MVLDLRVKTHDPLTARLMTAVDRATTPEPRGPQEADAVFSTAFIRRHTTFESLAAFCRACPSEQDTVGGVQRLPAEQRDAFVATTTDFETWSEMKRSAAVSDLVTLQNG